MVATLVGMMWWDQPLDQTLSHPPDTISARPPARGEVAPAVPTTPVPRAAQRADAPPAAPAPRAAERVAPATPAPRAIERATAPAPPSAAPRNSDTQARAKEPQGTAMQESASRASRSEPVTAAARSGVDAAAEPARRRALAAPAAKAAAPSSAAIAADKAALPRDDLRAAQGSAGSSRAGTQAADSMASPLAGLLASVAQEPERWRWQRGSADPKPMTPGLERWLKQLDKSTATRWRSATERAPHDRAGALSLWRDGVLQATLGFAQTAVWAETSRAPSPEPTPASVLAALPASSLETLRKALDDATP
jgi:hypothetical protein